MTKFVPHKIIAVANQKGGAGKSTTAGNLVWWLSQRYSVAFVDADAQASASTWMQSLNLPVFGFTDPDKLFDALPGLAEQYDVVVVDAPGSNREITKTVLDSCDLVVMPCRPSEFDLRGSGIVVEMLRRTRQVRGGKPNGLLFVNAAKDRRSILLSDALEELGKSEVPLAQTIIGDRTCIADAPTQQTTVFQMSGRAAKTAAAEYESLFTEVLEELNNG